jgi:hypothetical protein
VLQHNTLLRFALFRVRLQTTSCAHRLRRILRRLEEVLVSHLQIMLRRNRAGVTDPIADHVLRELLSEFRLSGLTCPE